jgi:hypothetical protein
MPFLAAIPVAVYAGIGAAGAIVGAGASLMGGMQAAAGQRAAAQAQEVQAQNAQRIAMYNANIQRQNVEVQYQMALYQSQYSSQMAKMNQAAALNNVQFAEFQALGARKQYEQGMLNAEQKDKDAKLSRLQSSEQANREREKNAQQIALMRSKYGASGVTFEGSPLVMLSDAARLGEANVQDVIFAGELQSRKELREGEITRFKAGFSLIDEKGFKVEAQNLKNKAAMFEYDSSLYEYDSAIAGVQKNIGMRQAKLVELGGEEKASAFQAAASESRYAATGSLISGFGGAASSALGGISSMGKAYYPTYTGKEYS